MSLLGWMIAVAVGVVLGLGASAIRRPLGIVANVLIAVLGGGIGAWLATVFGVAVEEMAALIAAAAGGAAVLVILLWSMRRG